MCHPARGFNVERGSAVRDEGYWLIDAVDEPINKEHARQRRRLIQAHLDELNATGGELAPEYDSIVCDDLLYQVAGDTVARRPCAGVHHESLPFRVRTGRERFAVRIAAVEARRRRRDGTDPPSLAGVNLIRP
jgi:hypothetical protein